MIKQMTISHYNLFLQTIRNLYRGFAFTYKKKKIVLPPIIPSPYDLIKDVKEPENDFEKFISTLPEGFRRSARSELYRGDRGWLERGVSEGNLVKFTQDESVKIIPVLSEPAVGIDSSSNVFVVCCFDNYQGGIEFVERFLHIPRSGVKNEFKWQKLNKKNRQNLNDNLCIVDY